MVFPELNHIRAVEKPRINTDEHGCGGENGRVQIISAAHLSAAGFLS
jgi:hypothetical protein